MADILDEAVAAGLGIPGGGAIVSKAKEFLGDIGGKIGDLAEDLWDGIKDAGKALLGALGIDTGCSPDNDKLYKQGITDALHSMGIQNKPNIETRWCGESDKQAWLRGFRETQKPVVATVGRYPMPDNGSLASAVWFYHINRAGNPLAAEQIKAALTQQGRWGQAEKEYDAYLLTVEAWREKCRAAWKAIQAGREPVSTPTQESAMDSELSEKAPAWWAIRKLYP